MDVTSNLRYLQETAKGTGFVVDSRQPDPDQQPCHRRRDQRDGHTGDVGRSYPARILGYDRANDVALLQVRGIPRLKAVTIGSSARVRVGMPVLAIGNEAGQGGSPTVAPGVISNLDRTIVATDQSSGLNETLHGMMQTSADIRPGDSGGPLAGADGRVIGINTGGRREHRLLRLRHPHRPGHAHRPADRGGRQGARVQIGLPAFLGVLLPDSSSTSPQRQARRDPHQTGAVSGGGSGCTSGDSPAAPASIAPAGTGALVNGVVRDAAARPGCSPGTSLPRPAGTP